MSMHRAFRNLALAVSIGFALAGSPAHASRMAGPTITGYVNAVSGVDLITINGQQYRVESGSAAASVLPSLKPGELVDAVLDGPPTSSASEIVAISPHTSD